jgi:lipoyl(octanoyl) transferase
MAPDRWWGYPIFDLDGFFTDVHRYVRTLEEVIIRTIGDYGLEGIRVPDYTGVWLEADEVLPKRKICAIGVHLSRWVSMHGFAFNVNTDLQYFRNIVPCGIDDKDKDVTSLSVELGKQVDLAEVREKILNYFSELFDFEIIKKIS